MLAYDILYREHDLKLCSCDRPDRCRADLAGCRFVDVAQLLADLAGCRFVDVAQLLGCRPVYHGSCGGVHARVYELAEVFVEIADHGCSCFVIRKFIGIKAAELRDIRGTDRGVEEEFDRVLGERRSLCYAAEDLLAVLAVGLVVDELPGLEVLSCDEREAGLVVAEHDSEECWGHGNGCFVILCMVFPCAKTLPFDIISLMNGSPISKRCLTSAGVFTSMSKSIFL